MPGLYHTLNIGAESLYASRQGVDTTGHNISNAQVEGYSRQKVSLTQRNPLQSRGLIIGNGTYVRKIERSHNQFIEDQINLSNQASGASSARYDALKSLEALYSPELMSNISDEVTDFFNSLEDLSNFPEEITVRTHVRESAQKLVSSFRAIDTNLLKNRENLNDLILQETKEISDLSAGIADLNTRIREVEVGGGGSANDLRDQRDRLMRELSSKVEINYYEDQHGRMVVRGPKETVLVDGAQFSKMMVKRNESNQGYLDVLILDFEGKNSKNITNGIEGGRLSSLVEVRDEYLPDLIKKNGQMAATLIDKFNEVHRHGFGVRQFSEAKGRDFFKSYSSVESAAREMSLSQSVIDSIDSIAAASTPNAPGDNVVVNELIRLADQPLMESGTATLTEYYANYTAHLGLDVLRTEQIKEADDIMSSDLSARRAAVSGVSLDEEGLNLMKWQSAFTASSKIITTVDEMIETVLGMKR